MPFPITCACGQTMTVDEQFMGHNVSCIQCGQPVAVPAAPQAAAPAQPAAQPDAAQQQAAQPAPAQPAAAAKPRGKGGKPRRTFVADWAQDVAEQWAEDHADHIASDEKPSTFLCTLGGLATFVIGGFNSLVFGLLLAGSIAAAALDVENLRRGWPLMLVITTGVVIALWTVVSGITCLMRRRGGASAAIPLNLVWALLALLVMLNVNLKRVETQFWFLFGGVVFLCCLGTVITLGARSQAARYQLWKVRKQQEAEGTLADS